MNVNHNFTVLGVLDSKSIGDGLKNSIELIVTDRLNEAVRLLSECVEEVQAKASAQVQQLQEELSKVREQLYVAVDNYNTAIQVINELSARVTALEANYDPTIIK
jgi:RecA/RadA recombinase